MAKASTQKLHNVHPGEVLREEFLIPLGISQYRLAKEIGVTEARISELKGPASHSFEPQQSISLLLGALRHAVRDTATLAA